MIVYSLIVLAAAVACAVLGRSIRKGNAELINCYRPERVKDKPVYCKKMGSAMYFMAAAMAFSAVINLFGETFAMVAVGVLFVGQIGSIACLVHVQKKYGGGFF